MNIKVKHYESMYELSEDNEFICAHIEYDVIEPCCSSVGSSGYIECSCNGMTTIECSNIDCDGIEEHRIDELINNYNESRYENAY